MKKNKTQVTYLLHTRIDQIGFFHRVLQEVTQTVYCNTTTIYKARWQKWISLEAKVAKELALRATKRGTMSNYALNQFKNALQSITTVRAAA